MAPRLIPASFWRGGTSRGVVFRPQDLAPYSPALRNKIVLASLGSPDKGGRQISGLGGGVSSLSKVCIVGVPGEGKEAQEVFGKLPGCEWADAGKHGGVGEWDIVYRIGQVGIRDSGIDWTATCGNMLSAAALMAVSTPLIPYSTLFSRARALPQPPPGSPLMLSFNILSASNGLLMRARVPIDPVTLQVWEPAEGEGCVIAGVPGEAAGIEVEMPIEVVEGVEGGLVTGRPKDVVPFEGQEIPISVISAGLPNIFLSITSLPLPSSHLSYPSSPLTTDFSLSSKLERLRQHVARRFSLPLSLASPKIVLVGGPVPEKGYTTSTGGHVARAEADLMVRAVSSGDWHATIPGTTLGAVNLGAGIPGTVIHDLLAQTRPAAGAAGASGADAAGEVVSVSVAHAAGVSKSSVRFVGEGKARRPESVVMMRTAREIMRGSVLVPERIYSDDE